MKQSTLFTSATQDEIYVAQILLDLPDLIRKLEAPLTDFQWSCKKRRSGLVRGASSSSRKEPSPSLQKNFFKIRERKAQPEAKSPNTPLSFSSGEPDEKSRRDFKRSSLKRSREEYVDLIDELTQRSDLLREEIENVTKYYNKLSAHNSELKRTKQEVLNSCLIKENPEVEISRDMNLEMQLIQNHQVSVAPHPQPLVADQMFDDSLGPITAQFFPLGNGLEPVNVGPFKTPDLNMSAEETNWVDPSQPLDTSIDRRARFAEARRRRRGMMKIKSMRSSCGVKLPAAR